MRRLSSHGNHVMHTCSQDTKFLKSTDGPHTATPLGLLTRGYRRVSPMRRRILLFHKCLASNRSLGNWIFMNENGGEEFGSKQAGLKSIIHIHNICISRSQVLNAKDSASLFCWTQSSCCMAGNGAHHRDEISPSRTLGSTSDLWECLRDEGATEPLTRVRCYWWSWCSW